MDIEVGVAIAVIGVMVGIAGLAYGIFRDRQTKRLNFAVRLYWVIDESTVPHSDSGSLHITNLSSFPVTIQTVELEPKRTGLVKHPQYLRLDDSLPFRMEPRTGKDWEHVTTKEMTRLIHQDMLHNRKRESSITTTAGETFKKRVDVEIYGIVGEEGYLKERMEEAMRMQD